MKKMIIAAAVVLAAVVSNAATVKWTASNVNDYSGGLLWDNANKSAYTATVYFFNADGSEFTALPSSTDTSYAMKAFSATTADKFEVGTTYLAQLVITGTEGGKTYEYSTGKEAFTVGAAAPALNFTSGADFDTFTGTSYAKGDWAAVPEPTSGLLLLLGMAGLALRRKQA
jgi:hypothetical protein